MMAKVKFGDVVKDVKINVDRSVDEHEFYIAGEHMDTENIHLTRKGVFKGADVGPAFIRLFKPGQVLYGSRRTYLKKVAVANFEGITSNTTFVLESKNTSILLQELLPFIMLTDSFTKYAIQNSKGSTNPYILFSDLAEYEFDLPDINEQKVLVSLLLACDKVKESYKRLIKETDSLVKSQFIEMTKSSPRNRIADICQSFGRGKSPSYVDHSNVRVINQACIYWDGLHLENIKYQNASKFKAENQLSIGAVLLNATGTGTLGRSYVFEEYDGVYMADSHVAIFNTRADVMLPRFLQIFFSLPTTQQIIYSDCVNGSTNQIELSKEKIGEVNVPVIDIEQQRQYIKFIEQSDKSKFVVSNRNLSRCFMEKDIQ